jgi:hypothetical protein
VQAVLNTAVSNHQTSAWVQSNMWDFFHRQQDHIGIAGIVDDAASDEQYAAMANGGEIVFHLVALETLVVCQDVFQ